MALSFTVGGLLHLYRRTSKPLFFGAKDHGIFYSSVEKGLEAIGCVNISEVTPNIMYQFKEGKLVNSIYVPDARYVKNLSCDVGMSVWRKEAGKEASDHIPETSLTSRRYQKKWGDSRQSERYLQTGSVRGKGSTEANKMFIDGRLKDIILDKPLDVGTQAKMRIWDAEARDSFVFIKAIDGNTNKPIVGQTIICPEADGEATTNSDGQAILYFKKYHGDTRLYTGDPKSKEIMYSSLITVKRGRVLEVTLKLPFLVSETTKKKDESPQHTIGFQFQNDGGTEDETTTIGDFDTHIYSEDWMDSQGSCGIRPDPSGQGCGGNSSYLENVRAGLVSPKLASRFDILDKKEELCDLFGITTDIPNISLELLEMKNTQLFENQEELSYLRDQLDIGNDLDDVDRTAKENRIIQMEAYVREIGDEMNTTIEQYEA
jgi:hypothetical protein